MPRICDALQYYAGHFDCVEDDDVEDLKRVGAEAVEKVAAFMVDARERLFDHDSRAGLDG